MKLIKARVQNFRSAEDSGEFDLDPVTCLVGKNEAGKSAVLLALATLNPHPSTLITLDKERDYPRRHLNNYATRHLKEEAIAVITTWQIEDHEQAAVAERFGTAALSSPLVTVQRRYGKQLEWGLSINLSEAFEHLFGVFKLSAPERSALKSATNTQGLIAAIKEMGSPSEKHQALQNYLESIGSVTDGTRSILQAYLPQFMYFSSYDRMDGAIQIEQTAALIANEQIEQEQYRGQKLFAEFLDYAGVPLDEITKVTTYETFTARLQGASNNITDQVLEYWTQNPDLSVEVKVEVARPGDASPLNTGTIARARIHNHLHRVDTPFSERSAGFVWFFSFLVKFAQVRDEENPVILLLDEPGLTLHGKAQGDLLRFFDEKLAPHHQIIYSTHSPFMVAPNRLMSARIVEDQVETKGPRRTPLGTKVRDDVLHRDPDTLFPLQGALGYEVSQSLFVGKDTLLVEGPGDILYLQALSDALRRRKRTPLDPRWTLCPAGGIDKIRPFVALFGSNGLNVAVLADQGANEKRKVDDLRRSEVLKAGQLYTVPEFIEGREEADIENVFEPALFVEVLNECYSPPKAKRVTVQSLADAAPTVRLVKKAEALFATMPSSVDEFDHFAPAAWLIRNPQALDGDTEAVHATLDRAEVIFKAFNALLK